MKTLILSALSLLALTAAGHAQLSGQRWLETEDGLRFVIDVPAGFSQGRAYPVLIAVPPGGGDEAMVQRALDLYLAEEADRRGWVVALPAAFGATDLLTSFHRDVGGLLGRLEQEMQIEGRPHLLGISHGGRVALRTATFHPGLFASLTLIPGAPADDVDWERLSSLKSLPVAFVVGSDDSSWLSVSRRAHEQLLAAGGEVQLVVRNGEGHMLEAGVGPWTFDRLERIRRDEEVRDPVRPGVSAVLDRLHATAAVADADLYFRLFQPDAVFIGTDAGERWDLDEFKAFAKPYFDEGQGWTYKVLERHVTAAEGNRIAWFDERLSNAKYGETRGSGVLVKTPAGWRISQYVLSFAVPNDVATRVVEVIRGETPEAEGIREASVKSE